MGAGYCYVLNDQILKEAKFKLANYCSVFQTDLFAIQCALKYINKNINNKSITISTDSQTLLKALKNVNSTTHLVYEIQKELTLAETKQIDISFIWEREHNGTNGNERANSLAKLGAVAHTRIAYNLIPVNYIKKFIYNKKIQIWDERWTTSTKG